MMPAGDKVHDTRPSVIPFSVTISNPKDKKKNSRAPADFWAPYNQAGQVLSTTVGILSRLLLGEKPKQLTYYLMLQKGMNSTKV